MAAEKFFPEESLNVYCRFCKKLLPAQLDRSIAGNGKTVDRASTFEYYCTKCYKTFCYSGEDLLPRQEEEKNEEAAVRDYLPTEHYFIGETIFHKKFKEDGVVVDKDEGSPSRILVSFEKNGLKKLVEDIG